MQENVFAYYMETGNTENTPTKAMNKNSSIHSLRPCNPAIILCGSKREVESKHHLYLKRPVSNVNQ